MEKPYSMQSRIRFLQGRVDVNYYNDDTSNEAKYIPQESQNNPVAGDNLSYIEKYAMQVVNGKLPMDQTIAVLGNSVDSGINDIFEYADEYEELKVNKEAENKIRIINRQVKSYANSRLDTDFVLCSENEASKIFDKENKNTDKSENSEDFVQSVRVGWLGSQMSDDNGYFDKGESKIIPKLTMHYNAPREIDHMVISGYNARDEYPLEFKLIYYKEKDEKDVIDGEDLLDKTPREVTYLDKNFFESRITEIEIEGKENFKRRDFILYFEPVIAKRMELQIFRWNTAYTIPKINYFASEHIECYLGDKLKSISIVEEKTGDTDKLSYGISSNSCNFQFLNEGKRFYYNKDYNLLRKNRRVYPYIRCGKGDFSKPLGVFYSDEWKIEDGNPYVSCKAYDVLYPLQDLTINYGMQESEIEQPNGSKKNVYSPYKCQTISQIFDRVFYLINAKRREAGIFSDIAYDLQLGEIGDKVIPLVLIEEKSAWDVLQDLANLTCSYIYCDRKGTVIVKCDDFSTPTITHNEAKQLVSVNPSNSFSYSLPVISQTVVNSVNTEYYDLEEAKKEAYKEVEIKDFVIDKNVLIAKVKLDKIYNNINTIECRTENENGSQTFNYEIINSSFDCLTLKVNAPLNITKLDVTFKYDNIYSLVKKNNIEQAETIDKFGLREFSFKVGNLLLNPENQIFKNSLNDLNNKRKAENKGSLELFDCTQMGQKIINKYKLGVTFVDAEWTGDYNLTLDSDFCAKSQYDEDGIEEIYECISSEITYDTRFKQKIKGRESLEIIHKDCDDSCNIYSDVVNSKTA